MKHKFTMKKHMVQTGVMSFLILAAVATAVKISSDYHASEVYSKEIDQNTVASDTVTTTPTATTTPTPTPTPAVAVKLNYETETITVSKGNGNSTRFYYSLDKNKSWNLIENSSGVMNLTVFLKSSANTIYFKGNNDDASVEVVIPKEENNLKVSYYVEGDKGKLKFENVTRPYLQYRKGTNGEWITITPQTSLDLSSYEITGYTLQFREKVTEAKRAGKIVNVKIPKRQNTPSIKVDYSKFILSGLKAEETQYRLSGSSTWIDFKPTDSKVKTISLAQLILGSNAAQNTPIPGKEIELRTVGTDKKVSSAILVIKTNTQPLAPNDTNIKLTGTTLAFTDASKTKPYEYVVLHANETLDLTKAKWTKVSSSKDIVIKKVGTATPVPGDIVYCRLASTTDTKTKEITPASLYVTKTITSIVNP